MRAYKFYAHFNRTRMQRGDSRVWTLHCRGMCMPAERITFNVPVVTDFKPNGRQPRATLRGICTHVIASSDEMRLIVV